jgi:hypothetical protein
MSYQSSDERAGRCVRKNRRAQKVSGERSHVGVLTRDKGGDEIAVRKENRSTRFYPSEGFGSRFIERALGDGEREFDIGRIDSIAILCKLESESRRFRVRP